ncbi:MAG: hypothetical protein ACRC6T_01605 [Sarcina sp.]
MTKRSSKTGTSMGSGLVYTRVTAKLKKNNIRKNKQAAICRECPHYSFEKIKCLKHNDKTANLYNSCPKTKNIK